MKIALTGGSGGIGRAIADGAGAGAPRRQHRPGRRRPSQATTRGISYIQADMADYDALVAGFAGCDARDPHGGDPASDEATPTTSSTTTTWSAATTPCAPPSRTASCGSARPRASTPSATPTAARRATTISRSTRSIPTMPRSPTACRNGSASSRPTPSPGATRTSASPRMRFHWVLPDRATAAERYKTRAGRCRQAPLGLYAPRRRRRCLPPRRRDRPERATRSSTSSPPTPSPTHRAASLRPAISRMSRSGATFRAARAS